MKSYRTDASNFLDTGGLSSLDIINFVSPLDNASVNGFREGFFLWNKKKINT